MKISTLTLMIATGLALSGASLIAGDRDWDRDSPNRYDRDYRDSERYERHEIRGDLRQDYAAIDRLRDRVAFDRARLDEDYRCRRVWAVDRDRDQLERDEAALRAMVRDVRHDQHELRESYGDYRRW